MSETTIQDDCEIDLGTVQPIPRGQRPVFVMGCHRSGTNLLYDTLLSAGGFAVYRGYTPIYKMLIPKFGNPENRENRARLVETWLHSKGYRRSGLTAKTIKAKLLEECHTGGDFIRIILNEISRNQNAQRWAIYDPDNVLYVPQVKADLPEALFVHIIRDGRDIALSLKKMEGFKPLPWNFGSSRGLLATAAYWEWMVRKGQAHGRKIPADYIEIRYEDLVSKPYDTMATLGRFLDHDLDYDRIQQNAQGSMVDPNSSFRGDGQEKESNPVGRWKIVLSANDVAQMESLIGNCLRQAGYDLATPPERRRRSLAVSLMGLLYPLYFDLKLWLKTYTPLRTTADIGRMGISDPPR